MASSAELGASEPRSFRVVEASLESLLVESVDVLHLGGGQSEIEELRVGINARGSHRLGDDDSGALESPSEENLGGSLTLLLGDLVDEGILHEGSGLMLGRHNITRRS